MTGQAPVFRAKSQPGIFHQIIPKKLFSRASQSAQPGPGSSNKRLENPGQIPLEIIEVQSGSYLGEDDIVRFEDHYGRKT